MANQFKDKPAFGQHPVARFRCSLTARRRDAEPNAEKKVESCPTQSRCFCGRA